MCTATVTPLPAQPMHPSLLLLCLFCSSHLLHLLLPLLSAIHLPGTDPQLPAPRSLTHTPQASFPHPCYSTGPAPPLTPHPAPATLASQSSQLSPQALTSTYHALPSSPTATVPWTAEICVSWSGEDLGHRENDQSQYPRGSCGKEAHSAGHLDVISAVQGFCLSPASR